MFHNRTTKLSNQNIEYSVRVWVQKSYSKVLWL